MLNKIGEYLAGNRDKSTTTHALATEVADTVYGVCGTDFTKEEYKKAYEYAVKNKAAGHAGILAEEYLRKIE